jgi:ATP-dependent RNA helicase RhlE
MTQIPHRPGLSFDGLGIAPKILEALDRMKFTVPTPIQHKAIPIAIEHKDLVGIAQTGTGKTLAFAIPVVQRLAQQDGHCLVLVPTRELALQVNEVFQRVAPLFDIRTIVIIGGVPINKQINRLKAKPRVLIATPGRLVDHLSRRTVSLENVNVLIIDEVDRMLDMGFLPDIRRILKRIPKNRQTMLFSATIPPEVMAIASAHMRLPVHIEIAPSGTTAERIVQELFIVGKSAKKQLLTKILNCYRGSVLLFSRTRRGAAMLNRLLRNTGYSAAEIHSDRSLSQRKQALEGFKKGRYRILVATDVAARGIDVTGIELVINYDVPENAENYVHRIGRTARAGHEGRAITFAIPEQGKDVRNIEKLIKTALPIAQYPEFPQEKFIQYAKAPGAFRRSGRRGAKRKYSRRP